MAQLSRLGFHVLGNFDSNLWIIDVFSNFSTLSVSVKKKASVLIMPIPHQVEKGFYGMSVFRNLYDQIALSKDLYMMKYNI